MKEKGKDLIPRKMFADMLRQVRRVPRGKVATYGDIAYAAGYPGAARQAAWALHQGHGDVPWQRIVGAGGAILCTGELGFEQRMKLQAEGVGFLGLKVNMAVHRHSFFPESSIKKSESSIKKPKSSIKKTARKGAKSAPRATGRSR